MTEAGSNSGAELRMLAGSPLGDAAIQRRAKAAGYEGDGSEESPFRRPEAAQ